MSLTYIHTPGTALLGLSSTILCVVQQRDLTSDDISSYGLYHTIHGADYRTDNVHYIQKSPIVVRQCGRVAQQGKVLVGNDSCFSEVRDFILVRRTSWALEAWVSL